MTIMGRKLKWIFFLVGLALLIFIIRYEFTEKNSMKSWNLPLSGKVIIVDPGHGGPDGGAGDSDALEKDIALHVSLILRDYLQQQGALVIMTREEDKDLASEDTKGLSGRKAEDLRARLKMINESSADLFLSIHLNSFPSSKWSGAQTFYAKQMKENRRAATFIQDELRTSLGNTNRKAKPINTIFILKHANKPGVLVEIGFLSNPHERNLLKSANYQEKVAVSIYQGVLRYFSKEDDLIEKE